jgi:hypothetical protein
MKLGRTGVWLFCLWAAGQPMPAAAAVQESGTSASDSASLFRVFLKDGTSLVSYGEMARLDDHVVFSMPTSASTVAPQLQLINIPSDTVDWERTLNYAESVRSSRYLATRAEADYALLSSEIEQVLNDVGVTDDPARRLAIVEKARRTLAEWPAAHYNYKRDEIQQMLGTLDEAIASLRAAIGSSNFDLAFVAPRDVAPAAEPILPAPDPAETIEQTLRAARLTPSPAERVSLLTIALNALDSESANLPAGWVKSTRAMVSTQIAKEVDTDRQYKALAARMLRLATSRARMADVRGVQRVLTDVKTSDEALGSARPEAVASIIASVQEQLDAARRLRLERDRWALRAPELLAYEVAIRSSLSRLDQISPLLEDIKSLAGSGPNAIGAILRGAAQVQKVLSTLDPPSELRDVHSLFTSAVQLADNAAKIRREAAITGSMTRAWDASSAAAGALMLAAKARIDLVLALRPPRLLQ